MVQDLNIRAGWLIDGTGSPLREKPLIRVRQGLIESVTPASEEPLVQEGVEFLDLPGRTLIPTLADAHVHLFMSPDPDPAVRQAQLRANYQDLVPAMAAHAARLLRYGVLAVRDGGDYGGFSLRYRDRTPDEYPIIRSPGRAWRARGRYGRMIGRTARQGLPTEISQQPPGPDHVKLVGSGINSLREFGRQTAPQFDAEELRAGVAAAHERGLKVMIHANGVRPVAAALRAGCDSLEHGFFMGRENLERMAGAGCLWVPTAVTMAGYAETLEPGDSGREMARRILDHQLEQIAQALRLGVRIACGTDSGSLGVVHGPSLGQETALLIKAGMSLEEAVASAASRGAGLLGLGERLGRIVPGREATFLVFKARPEELASGLGRPEHLFIKGVKNLPPD